MHTLFTELEDACYCEGFAASENNVGRDTNPYRSDIQASSWLGGWIQSEINKNQAKRDAARTARKRERRNGQARRI